MGRDRTGTLRVGDMAPDFALDSSEGETMALESFRGEAVLLIFVRGPW